MLVGIDIRLLSALAGAVAQYQSRISGETDNYKSVPVRICQEDWLSADEVEYIYKVMLILRISYTDRNDYKMLNKFDSLFSNIIKDLRRYTIEGYRQIRFVTCARRTPNGYIKSRPILVRRTQNGHVEPHPVLDRNMLDMI